MIYYVIRNFSLKSAPLTRFLSALNTIMILVFHLISFVTRFFGTGAFVWKNTWYLQDLEIPTVIFTQWLTPINNYDFVKSKFYWNCTLLLPYPISSSSTHFPMFRRWCRMKNQGRYLVDSLERGRLTVSITHPVTFEQRKLQETRRNLNNSLWNPPPSRQKSITQLKWFFFSFLRFFLARNS